MQSAILARTGPTPRADSAPVDTYVILGLVLAGLLVGVYIVLRATRRSTWPDLGDLVTLVATSTAVTAGIRIAIVSITADELVPFHSDDRIFLPIAGLALVLVSARTIWGILREAGGGTRAP